MFNENFNRMNARQMRRDAARDGMSFWGMFALAMTGAALFAALVTFDPMGAAVDQVIEARDR